jgi:hypothetical protein
MDNCEVKYNGENRRVANRRDIVCPKEMPIAALETEVEHLKEHIKLSLENIHKEVQDNATASLETLSIIRGDGSAGKPGMFTDLAVAKSAIKRIYLYVSGITGVLGLVILYLLRKKVDC